MHPCREQHTDVFTLTNNMQEHKYKELCLLIKLQSWKWISSVSFVTIDTGNLFHLFYLPAEVVLVSKIQSELTRLSLFCAEKAKLNFYLLVMNGVRVLFTKTLAFNTILTIRGLLVWVHQQVGDIRSELQLQFLSPVFDKSTNVQEVSCKFTLIAQTFLGLILGSFAFI